MLFRSLARRERDLSAALFEEGGHVRASVVCPCRDAACHVAAVARAGEIEYHCGTALLRVYGAKLLFPAGTSCAWRSVFKQEVNAEGNKCGGHGDDGGYEARAVRPFDGGVRVLLAVCVVMVVVTVCGDGFCRVALPAFGACVGGQRVAVSAERAFGFSFFHSVALSKRVKVSFSLLFGADFPPSVGYFKRVRAFINLR